MDMSFKRTLEKNSIENVRMTIPNQDNKEKLDYVLDVNIDHSFVSLLRGGLKMVQAFGLTNAIKLGIQTALLGNPIQMSIVGARHISVWEEFKHVDPVMSQQIVISSPLFPMEVWNEQHKLWFGDATSDIFKYYEKFNFKPLSLVDLKNVQFVMTPPFNVGAR